MVKFFDLKKTLFFPKIAGFMRSKKDVPYLYDLLLHERQTTRENTFAAIKDLENNGLTLRASRLMADWRAMDMIYEHDIALCATFMLDNGIKPI